MARGGTDASLDDTESGPGGTKMKAYLRLSMTCAAMCAPHTVRSARLEVPLLTSVLVGLSSENVRPVWSVLQHSCV